MMKAGAIRAGEIACRTFRRSRRDEDVPIERVEVAGGAVKAKSPLALVANNDAGDLVTDAIDGVSFRHDSACIGFADVLLR